MFSKSKLWATATVLSVLALFVFVFIIRLPERDRTAKGVENAVRLTAQFNPLTGEHIDLKKYVIKTALDPDSYQHISTKTIPTPDGVTVIMNFRAKNTFGGYAPTEVLALCDSTGHILDAQFFPK
jgi:hypothetical protein